MKHPQRRAGAFGVVTCGDADLGGVSAGFELVIKDQRPGQMQTSTPMREGFERAICAAVEAELDAARVGSGGDEKAAPGAFKAELKFSARLGADQRRNPDEAGASAFLIRGLPSRLKAETLNELGFSDYSEPSFCVALSIDECGQRVRFRGARRLSGQ